MDAAGNARTEVESALRKSRASRLRRRVAWCDSEIARLLASELTEQTARRGLELIRLRGVTREMLRRAEVGP